MVHPASSRVGSSVLLRTHEAPAAKVRRTAPSDAVVAAVDPQGRLVCVAHLDSLQLFAAEEPLAPRALTPTGVVRSVCFSRCGGVLLSGGDDKAVRAWDVTADAAAAPIGTWTHHKKIGCVAFAPLPAGGETSLLGLWADKFGEVFAFDVRCPSAAPLLKLGHLSPVSHLAFTPGGGELVTADREGHVRASRWPSADIIERYYLTHTSPVEVVLPLAALPLLLTAAGSGAEVCLWRCDGAERLWKRSAAELLRLLRHAAPLGPDAGDAPPPAPPPAPSPVAASASAGSEAAEGSACGEGAVLRCACELAASRLLYLGFDSERTLHALEGAEAAEAELRPRPGLALELRSPPLALQSPVQGRLFALCEFELLCFALGEGGRLAPSASFRLSELPPPSVSSAAAADGDEEGEE